LKEKVYREQFESKKPQHYSFCHECTNYFKTSLLEFVKVCGNLCIDEQIASLSFAMKWKN